MTIDLGYTGTKLGILVRPISTWSRPYTQARNSSLFRSTWSQTLELLRYELEKLSPERVILEMDLPPGSIRRDGLPRADARPSSPAVQLRIELEPGRWMSLPCDTYLNWQENVRAIALTLKSLRDIDRYGVTKSGEQYEGWMSLPARTGGDPIHSVDGAAAFLAEHSGMTDAEEAIATVTSVRKLAYRKAAAALHPDAGGSPELFARLQTAARVLELNTGEEQPS